MDIDKRQDISELQRFLRSIAYYDSRVPLVPVDGIFGEKTAAAVEAYQSYYNLPVTGVVDEATWNSIYNEYLENVKRTAPPERIVGFSPEEKLTVGSSGYPVYYLQLMLKRLADSFENINDVDISGVYDQKTDNAVKMVSNAHQKQGDGVDKETWNDITRLHNQTFG